MITNTDIFIPAQIPEHIRNSVPKFITFLQAYYEFLAQYNIDIKSLRDSDLTPNNLVTFLKNEFANKFPEAYVDDRKLIQIINEVYKKKGTTDAIRLLFKLFYNKAIDIEQPNKYMFRPSSGKWEQQNSIDIQDVWFNADQNFTPEALNSYNVEYIRIENELGIFFLEIDFVEGTADEAVRRFFYKGYLKVPIFEDQLIDLITVDGTILYRGKIVSRPSSIEILSPGKYWKKGQVFYFPSSEEGADPIIAMVTEIDSDGGISKIRIIQYGEGHTENQRLLISPFSTRPGTGNYDLTEAYDDLTSSYSYDLVIGDAVDVFEPLIGAYSSILSTESMYFLASEEYSYDPDSIWWAEPGYIGGVPPGFPLLGTLAATVFEEDGLEITLDEWLESRAALQINFGVEKKFPGKYLTSEGQVSNPYVRIQDSFFYQLFSYVVLSSVDIKDFSSLLSMIHPAGTKFFSELQKTPLLDIGSSITTTRQIYQTTFSVTVDSSSITADSTEITVTESSILVS